MKRLLVLVVLVVHSTADAGHSCHEVSDINGYERCSRFGDWDADLSAVLEVGVSTLHFRADPLDTMIQTPHDGVPTTYHLEGGGDDVTAIGAQLRVAIVGGRTWYVANQWDFAPVVGGPPVNADITARGMTTTTETETRGFVLQSAILLGAHRRFGVFSVSAEMGVGARELYSAIGLLPDTDAPPKQLSMIVPTGAKLDFWLSPSISLGVGATVDVLQPETVGIGLVLGVHLMPYDMSR